MLTTPTLGDAMTVQTRGIDVSHYQGNIQWPSVADSDVAFCFIKATEGTAYVDPMFQANWSGSSAAGLYRGAYHFGRPGSDPIAQAQLFYNTVSADGTLGPGDLPPALDLETLDGQSPADVLQWTLAFLARADELFGRRTILYTDPGFWQSLQNLPGCQVLASRPLWLAAYSAVPHTPPPWSSWTFWQYSDGSANGGSAVPGVSGEVDQDWFVGTAAQLANLG